MKKPYVSCIMPTANRENFIPYTLDIFLNQDYRDVELVIVDDGKRSVQHLIPDHPRIKYYYVDPIGSIGSKRNYACEKAKGEIIMHWDDDDWYAYDWITRTLTFIKSSNADICGLNNILFYSPLVGKFWRYKDENKDRPYIAGATMAYKKDFWRNHPFKDIQIGEDYDYIWNSGATIFAHEYSAGFIATLHARNTTLKPFENPNHKIHAIAGMNVSLVPKKH